MRQGVNMKGYKQAYKPQGKPEGLCYRVSLEKSVKPHTHFGLVVSRRIMI